MATTTYLEAIREGLAKARGRIVGVTPIIAGKSLKGPLDRIMQNLGLDVSSYGVAQLYKGVLDGFVIDEADKALTSKIAALGIHVRQTNTLMDSPEARVRLARDTVSLAEGIRK